MFSIVIGSDGLVVNGHQMATAEQIDRALRETRPVASAKLLPGVTAPAPGLAAAVTTFLNGAAVLDLEDPLRPELRGLVSRLADVAQTGEWARNTDIDGGHPDAH